MKGTVQMRLRNVDTSLRFAAVAALAVLFVFGHAIKSAVAAPRSRGFVYVMTNQTSGNTVIQYARASDGTLTKVTEVATNGLGGTGNGVGPLDPLGSQDSLVQNGNGSLLLAVN